ncbi:MAG: hypothetical protein AAF492_01590, partial [Verrucomicrobiota bacterium]
DITLRASEDLVLNTISNAGMIKIMTTGDGAISIYADGDQNHTGNLSTVGFYVLSNENGNIYISGEDVDTGPGILVTSNTIAMVASNNLTIGPGAGFTASNIIGQAFSNIFIGVDLTAGVPTRTNNMVVGLGLLAFDAGGSIFEATGVVGDVTLKGDEIGLNAGEGIGTVSDPIQVDAESLLVVRLGDINQNNFTEVGVPPDVGMIVVDSDTLKDGLPTAAAGQPVPDFGISVLSEEDIVRGTDPNVGDETATESGSEKLDAVREEVARITASLVQEIPGARELANQFQLYYFLHQSMKMSEYNMELNLSFVDYLVFGDDQTLSDPLLPPGLKRDIYTRSSGSIYIYADDEIDVRPNVN